MNMWNPLIPDSSESSTPYRIYNIGNNNPVSLVDFIATIEKSLGMEAKKTHLPMQNGDVKSTFADIDALVTEIDYQPKPR
jgi:UDP-glucuronate 4-epimerase